MVYKKNEVGSLNHNTMVCKCNNNNNKDEEHNESFVSPPTHPGEERHAEDVKSPATLVAQKLKNAKQTHFTLP